MVGVTGTTIGYCAVMSDRTDRAETTDAMHAADVRNGEPDALDEDATEPERSADDPAIDPDLDVTEPPDDGEPIHHVAGGDIGDGAD